MAKSEAGAPRWRWVLGTLLAAVALGAGVAALVPLDGRLGWDTRGTELSHAPRPLDAFAPAVARPWCAPSEPVRLSTERAVDAGLAPGNHDQPLPTWFERLCYPGGLADLLALSPNQQWALRWSPLSQLPIAVLAREAVVPVVNWHDVVDGRKLVNFDVELPEFDAQLERIAEAGAHPISLEQWWGYMTRGDKLPEKPLLLTFDDGYDSIYHFIYPRLRARGWPAAFFIVPSTVGRKLWSKGHVTWEQCEEMAATGLYAIQGHSLTHPHLVGLPTDKLHKEVLGCREAIESHLGRCSQFFCYPNGKYDAKVKAMVEDSGYVAAFAYGPGGSAQSKSMFEINRYDQCDLAKALVLADAGTLAAAPTPSETTAAADSVRLEGGETVIFRQQDFNVGGAKVPMCWAAGGKPISVHCDYRYAVGDVVNLTGAAAAINGSFFQLARVKDISNAMLGPVMSQLTTRRDQNMWRQQQLSMPSLIQPYNRFVPGEPQDNVRLVGRPMVLIGSSGTKLIEFRLDLNSKAAVQAEMPDVTDAFVGGGWLVRGGKALTKAEMDGINTRDHNDFRRRAWFGLDKDGHPALGATPSSQRSEVVAKVLEQIGIVDAALLDSGFSTSLIYNGQLYVTGHSDAQPSRPVPHMILLQGQVDTASVNQAEAPDLAKMGNDPGAAVASNRGKRLKRANPRGRRPAGAPAGPGAPTPLDPPAASPPL